MTNRSFARRAVLVTAAISRRLRLGGGSTVGGHVGLALDRTLLAELAADRPIALVSGTNGKTTTTRLLAEALGGAGHVATSEAGANMPAGLVTALAPSPPGRPGVLEVDEGYLTAVAEQVRPRVVVLLNLSRDQLDRVSEVRMVASRWRQGLQHLDTTVVANADDPLVVWSAGLAGRVVWVGAGVLWNADAYHCPACDARLEVPAGSSRAGWRCTCGFARPATAARLERGRLQLADGTELPLRISLPGRFNEANAAMAAMAAGALGTDATEALARLARVEEVAGRFSNVDAAGHRVRLLLAKNPAGWTELLEVLATSARPVVIAVNARLADGHDPSWLWDVPFERLAGKQIVATGDRRLDLAVRLRHAGVERCVVDDPLAAIGSASAGPVDFVGNYTAFQDLRRQVGSGRKRPSAPGTRDAAQLPTRHAPAAVVTESTEREGSSPLPRSLRSALRIVVVHPDLLGTYGDGGNGRILANRAAWRGVPVELLLAPSDLPLPASCDLYCLGGGEDAPQVRSAELLRGEASRAGALAQAVADGAVVLAVCAGFQILGTRFAGPGDGTVEGAGLLDVETSRGSGPRAVGEAIVEPDPELRLAPGPDGTSRLSGFENHAGRTTLGLSARPLGRVLAGVGNGDRSRPAAGRTGTAGGSSDGCWSGRVFGTYLHGPVLARNPTLADLLLGLATGITLSPLDDAEEQALLAERLGVAGSRSDAVIRRRQEPGVRAK